jgi:hypothetical protein
LITFLSFVELRVEKQSLAEIKQVNSIRVSTDTSCITMEELFSISCKNIEQSYKLPYTQKIKKDKIKLTNSYFPTIDTAYREYLNAPKSKKKNAMINFLITMFDISPFILEKSILIKATIVLEIYFANIILYFKHKFIPPGYKKFIYYNTNQIFKPPIYNIV